MISNVFRSFLRQLQDGLLAESKARAIVFQQTEEMGF
jgi:hypothetical protein